MVTSSLFFLDLKGKILISRDYRGDIPIEAAESFIDILNEREEEGDGDGGFGEEGNGNSTATTTTTIEEGTPVLNKNGVNYIYVKYNNLYVLALTKQNSNVMVILSFLHRLIQVFREYFNELEEESLRDNFVVVYELLDEMMDFGYPQMTETKVLKEYITQQSFQMEPSKTKSGSSNTSNLGSSTAISSAGAGKVSWRAEGIKYRKNEVFLDVVESVNLLVNSEGLIVKNEVIGQVKVRCYLSGMPELRLGLNDKILMEVKAAAAAAATDSRTNNSFNNPYSMYNNSSTSPTGTSPANLQSSTAPSQSAGKSVEMEDVKFHQCVKLARFDQDRTISFIPPDGDFELLSYRVASTAGIENDLRPLIWTEIVVEKWTESTVEYKVTARSQYKRRSSANALQIDIPVPIDSDSPRLKASMGTAYYAPESNCVRWHIGYFPGGKEFTLNVKVGLPALKSTPLPASPRHLPPVSVSFEIPYYTMSGIQVRYLKIVEKSGYPALPWVRYITQSGEYQFRMPDLQI